MVSPEQSWWCWEWAELLWSCMANILGQFDLLGIPHQQFGCFTPGPDQPYDIHVTLHLGLLLNLLCSRQTPDNRQGPSYWHNPLTHPTRAPSLPCSCTSCRDCHHVPSASLQIYTTLSGCSTASHCFKLSQLEKLQRNKECPWDTMSTREPRADLGQGHACLLERC